MTASAERIATSNAWAFLHWLRATGRPRLGGWPELIAWSHTDPAAFAHAVAGFADVPDDPTLTSAAAAALLHADLRPDDRVLVAAGPAWPWEVARRWGSEIVFADAAGIAAMAVTERASVLIADVSVLVAIANELSGLRCVLALGGPMPPAVRIACPLSLARAGDWLWGSVLDSVSAHAGPPLRFGSL